MYINTQAYLHNQRLTIHMLYLFATLRKHIDISVTITIIIL